jgi:two-component system osmolarity sensor histidine kinase EnvZ
VIARLIPKTLFGRNLLLIVVLIIVGQIAAAVLYRGVVQEQRISRFAALTALQVKATQSMLSVASAPARREFIAALSRAPDVVTVTAGPIDATSEALPQSWLVRNFLRRLRQELPPGADVRWQPRPASRLWIAMDVPEQTYWLGFRVERLENDFFLSWLLMSVTSGLLALFGAYVIQRRLNRPLERLVHAAAVIGRGEQPGALPTGGPREIAALGASFNTMSGNLARLESDRAVMLAGVSHDLRTPLAKMRIALEILRDKPDSELLAMMARQIEAMDGIIGQFLSYARIGNDEALEWVDMNAMLVELRDAYREQQIEFAGHLETLPKMRLRPVAIRRVLVNLLENAVRHGKPAYGLSAQVHRGVVRISVRDHGEGLPAGTEEDVKRPFVRLHSERGAKGIGAGLGLAICERIVRMHEGKLVLRNREGGGLEVHVELPM